VPNTVSTTIDRIHEHTMRILDELGIAFHCKDALELLKASGFRVKDGRAFFTAKQVESSLDMTKKVYTVKARNPKYDMLMSPKNLYLTPGYGSSYISDTDGKLRDATIDDFLTLANIVQVSGAFSINGGILAQPCNIPAFISAEAMVYATLKRSDKVLLSVSADGKKTRNIMKMLELVFGTQRMRTEPHCFTLISTMSPLAIDTNACESIMVCAEHGQVSIIAPGPMAGGTGPISLAGNIALANAEILGVNVMMQIVNPGTPLVYGFAATVSDMQDMSVSSASPGFLKQALWGARMAKHYGLPFRSGGGMSDAGGMTAQAGVESAMNLFVSFSEGVNLVMHATGSLHSFGSVNYEKFILDIETCERLRYYFEPLDDSVEALALEPLREVIETGGQFMTHDHTFARCRLDPWIPQISLHGRSKAEPNMELFDSLRKRMGELLASYVKPDLPPETEKALDDQIRAAGLSEEFIRMV
jgi:trimethylamine---corrinoid protein Co-methyltransferase